MTPHPVRATYRVQLTPAFGFAAVTAILPDLAALGVSHVYLSPVAEAVTGSTHGYDVVDPARVRDELGGWDGLVELGRAAATWGMGLIVDLVPNHVATAEPERNPWWWGLLRGGPTAPEAGWFDVDWERAGGRVIVPVLGAPLTEVIAAGELRVDGDVLRYHERTFPLRAADGDGAAPGMPVDAVVDRQHYRPQFWRDPERNVRRFFTIDDLVAIRPEVPAVADAVHRVPCELARLGLLDGVRVDHVDGLADPGAYLHGLRTSLGGERWIGVEKIVVGDERLPAGWPVEGTTGYEWIRLVDHLFTHPAGRDPLTDLWRAATGDDRDYHDHEREGVRAVLSEALRPDRDRVARVAARELSADIGHDALAAAITDLTVELGRYRTYLTSDGGGESDRELVRATAERAAAASHDGTVVSAVADAILAGGETATRWQQLTGPALAKGGEDRALYRWFRLAAHNEVGGDPGTWTLPLADFHAHNAHVADRWPATLLAGSTHDTKRSEDVRARLLVLAELGPEWRELVERWQRAIGPAAPDGRSLLLGLQTAVGAWPIDAGRLGEYLVKAAREAAIGTTWTDPDDGHEAALHRLAGVLVAEPLAGEFERFVATIEPGARHVALAQLVLRCTAPGVPDVYQGGEAWLHTLVDPDNRAPIDPARLAAAAAAATAAGDVWRSAHLKAAVLARALDVRRRFAPCFAPGSGYTPLTATGQHADHVVAFARSAGEGATIIAVASRFPRSRPDGWGDTALELPVGIWHDALAADGPRAGAAALADLLGDHPAALLTPSP